MQQLVEGQSQDIPTWVDDGYHIEVVLGYEPADGGNSTDLTNYVEWVLAQVKALAAYSPCTATAGCVNSIQIGNEADNCNINGGGCNQDAAYADAVNAVADGVIWAKGELNNLGNSSIKIGFNSTQDEPQSNTSPNTNCYFWAGLKSIGGSNFANSVDWVGMDLYPYTYTTPSNAGSWVGTAVNDLNGSNGDMCGTASGGYLQEAGLSTNTQLRMTEFGYPSAAIDGGPASSQANQARTLYEMDAAADLTGIYEANWFDLTDCNSTVCDSTYHISHDGLSLPTYSTKSAYSQYESGILANGYQLGC